MIYLDSVGINFLIQELKVIYNKKINKIEQYERGVISLFFGRQVLTFAIKQNDAIFFLSEKQNSKNSLSSMFLMQVKKYLLSSFLVDINQIYMDRIIKFTFTKTNHLGIKEVFYIVFEIRSRNSDLLLLDSEDKIIANLYNSFDITKKNSIGTKYIYLKPEGVSPLEIEQNTDMTLIYGLDKKKTFKNISDIKNYTKTLLNVGIDGKNNLIFNDESIINKFSTINEAINSYFNTNDNSVSFVNKKREVENNILKKIKKLKSILNKIEMDLEKIDNVKIIKKEAQLLMYHTNLNEMLDSITLFDYEENNDVVIKLDNNITILENAQKKFNSAKKIERTLSSIIKRKEEILSSIKENELLLDLVNNEISVEVLDSMLLKKEKKKVDKVNKIFKEKYNNSTIYVGKNNIENDKITFKIANKNDIWLHIKDYPGSHVIIKDYDDNQDTLLYAAHLAAKNSKAPLNSKVIVDYTKVKNVKKIHKEAPGQVTYTNQKSINVIKE